VSATVNQEGNPATGVYTDILVADRRFPAVDPGGGLFIVYPQENPTPFGFTTGEMAEGLRPTSWNREHPAIRGIDFSRLAVDRATRLLLPPDAEVLVRSGTFPLIAVGDTGGRRWMALSFDILESSLPLRAAFPLLINRALAWLAPVDPDQAAFIAKSGEDWILPAEFRGREWNIRGPGGSAERFPPSDNPRVPGINQTGFWTAQTDDVEITTGVSLVDAGESELRPRWFPPEAPGTTEIGRSDPKKTPRRNGLASTLAAVALVILLFEWFLQTRNWRTE
jgi:hypothetical protein